MDTDVTPASPADGSRPGPLHAPVDERQRRACDAVVGVARSAGLVVAGAGVWRAGSAVLVGLPAVPALARVDEPSRSGDAERQVRVARVLADAGVPAVGCRGPGAPAGGVARRAGDRLGLGATDRSTRRAPGDGGARPAAPRPHPGATAGRTCPVTTR